MSGDAYVLIDGKLGMHRPLSQFRVSDLQLLEVYPSGTEVTGTGTEPSLLYFACHNSHTRQCMTRSAWMISLLCASAGLARSATAQAGPQVRFTTVDSTGDHERTGRLQWVTRDSLLVLVQRTDKIVAFSRTVVRKVERRRWNVSPARAAGIGCLATGAALGALGYFGTHDPDSPGLEKTFGVIGAVGGCAAGAVGGLVTSAVRGHRWESWSLPDSAFFVTDSPRER